MTRGKTDRQPVPEDVTFEYVIVLKSKRSGKKTMEITFSGDQSEQVQAVAFWPNGRIKDVENSTTDKLLEFLRGELAARHAASPPE